MTDGMSELAERLAGLPDAEREQWLERFLHEIEQSTDVYRLSETERSLVREGLADLDAGRIVAGQELERFWNRNKRP